MSQSGDGLQSETGRSDSYDAQARPDQRAESTASEPQGQEKPQSELCGLVECRILMRQSLSCIRDLCHVSPVTDEILCGASPVAGNPECNRSGEVSENEYLTSGEHADRMITSLWHDELEKMVETRDFGLNGKKPKLRLVETNGGYVRQLTIPGLSRRDPNIVLRDIIVLDPLISMAPARRRFKVVDMIRKQHVDSNSSQVETIIARNDESGRCIVLPYPKSDQHQTWSSTLSEVDSELSPKIGDSFDVDVNVWPRARFYEVMRIEEDTLTIGTPFELSQLYPNQKDIEEGSNFTVYLISAGTSNRRCHTEVACLERFQQLLALSLRFHSTEPPNIPKLDVAETNTLHLRRTLGPLDESQRKCVSGILKAECRPFPYIVHGPPGTGKTSTIIEAIVQLHMRDPSLLVLLCARSYTCRDNLYNQLVRALAFGDRVVRRVNPTKRFCGDPFFRAKPLTKEPNQARIFVTDETSARSLVDSFDYIFVDDFSYVTESRLSKLWERLERTGCLVIAGDVQQIAPVVDFVFHITLYEGLLPRSPYEANSSGGDDYDSRFITKLNVCYRCDPRLMVVSNELFYNNSLQCRGRTPPSIMRILKLKRPILLLELKAGFGGPKSLPSTDQVNACLAVLQKLYSIGIEPSQVAITCMYSQQQYDLMKSIRGAIENDCFGDLNERFRITEYEENDGRMEKVTIPIDWMCDIETVESFQGGEKEIVILYTVTYTDDYTQPPLLERVFELVVSRPKCLLIVVGKSNILSTIRYWSQLLRNAQRVLWSL